MNNLDLAALSLITGVSSTESGCQTGEEVTSAVPVDEQSTMLKRFSVMGGASTDAASSAVSIPHMLLFVSCQLLSMKVSVALLHVRLNSVGARCSSTNVSIGVT